MGKKVGDHVPSKLTYNERVKILSKTTATLRGLLQEDHGYYTKRCIVCEDVHQEMTAGSVCVDCNQYICEDCSIDQRAVCESCGLNRIYATWK